MTQACGKIYCVLGLEESTLLKMTIVANTIYRFNANPKACQFGNPHRGLLPWNEDEQTSTTQSNTGEPHYRDVVGNSGQE